MRRSTAPFWKVGVQVDSVTEFHWTGRTNSAPLAEEQARDSARRCRIAILAKGGINRFVPVKLIRGARQHDFATIETRTMSNLREDAEQMSSAIPTPTGDEVRALLAALLRTEVARQDLPRESEAVILRAGLSDKAAIHPTALVVDLAGREAALSLTTEGMAALEVLCFALQAAGDHPDAHAFCASLRYGESQTLRAAVRLQTMRSYAADCAMLASFARRYGDLATAAEYAAHLEIHQRRTAS